MSSEEEIADVLIVGAGLSGIGSAALLRRRLPGKRVAIVEARAALGGTWDLFRYPGVRSDSDMYTLGFKARPWRSTQSIVDGLSIRRYLQESAEEAGLLPLMQFNTEVQSADWKSGEACWNVTLKDRESGATRLQRARFMHLCNGYYRYSEAWRPTWEGEGAFRGRIVHPQFWPEGLDYRGKQVLVIGSGATAVTLVPALAEQAAQVTMLQRSPSYIVSRPARDPLAQWLTRWLPARLTYPLVRWKNILLTIFLYSMARKRPAQVRERIVGMAAEQLPPGFDVATHFTPRYNPWDQRVCLVPDGDLFKAIRGGRVAVATDTIARFTPGGVLLQSGRELAADIVVAATGLHLNVPASIAVSVDGAPMAWHERMIYKGAMFTGVPNLVQTFGYTNASWTLRADLIALFLCRLLAHMQRHGHTVAQVLRDPTVGERPLLDFTSGYVQRSVALLPRQGDRGPWRLHQNYVRDLFAARFSVIDDGVVRFGVPAATRVAAAQAA